MQLDEIMDLDVLNTLIEDHYITARDHPSLPLTILNYSAKTQYDHHWTPETRACRGLIFDWATKFIVARPFEKFFNLGEHEGALPAESFTAYEKLDGSLGVAYIDADDLPSIATRGSFTSDQAKRATALLRKNYDARALERMATLMAGPEGYTFCFEIILPENRIVVDYGAREDLVLLAVLETASGRDIHVESQLAGQPFSRPRKWLYENLEQAVESVDGPDFDNQEGVVVRFESGLRLKIKREEYVKLHRLVTGITPRRIWEMLMDGSPPIGRLYAGTPEGFQQWAQEVVAQLEGRFKALEVRAGVDYSDIMQEIHDTPRDRGAFARLATQRQNPAVLFKLYDGKPYAETIWKRIKPGAAEPYRVAE